MQPGDYTPNPRRRVNKRNRDFSPVDKTDVVIVQKHSAVQRRVIRACPSFVTGITFCIIHFEVYKELTFAERAPLPHSAFELYPPAEGRPARHKSFAHSLRGVYMHTAAARLCLVVAVMCFLIRFALGDWLSKDSSVPNRSFWHDNHWRFQRGWQARSCCVVSVQPWSLFEFYDCGHFG